MVFYNLLLWFFYTESVCAFLSFRSAHTNQKTLFIFFSFVQFLLYLQSKRIIFENVSSFSLLVFFFYFCFVFNHWKKKKRKHRKQNYSKLRVERRNWDWIKMSILNIWYDNTRNPYVTYTHAHLIVCRYSVLKSVLTLLSVTFVILRRSSIFTSSTPYKNDIFQICTLILY